MAAFDSGPGTWFPGYLPATLASVLSARIIPARGGETEYVSTRLAWERLEDASRKRLENSFAWHDYAHSRRQIAPDLVSAEERAALPPQCWRMAWTNPVNGRCALYLASHASHVVGWPVPEGRLLLRDLTEHATQPGFVYRHAWHAADLVIWDNLATMHRARAFDDSAHRRELRRVTTLDLRS